MCVSRYRYIVDTLNISYKDSVDKNREAQNPLKIKNYLEISSGSALLRGAPSDLRGGGWAVFCAGFLLVALGLQFFLWPMLGFFLVVALLHDFFFLLFCLARIFFW